MRKTLKYSCLLLIMAISLCACPTAPEADCYNLALHFRDASGKDLTKGIELEEWSYGESIETADWGVIPSDLYELGIVPRNYYNGELLEGPNRFPALYVDELEMNRFDGVGYCLSNSFIWSKEGNDVRKLTYKIRCPYVFGDNKEHEFVTYWDLNPHITEVLGLAYASCYRIEYEGKEFTPQPVRDNYHVGIIVLDRAVE